MFHSSRTPSNPPPGRASFWIEFLDRISTIHTTNPPPAAQVSKSKSELRARAPRVQKQRKSPEKQYNVMT